MKIKLLIVWLVFSMNAFAGQNPIGVAQDNRIKIIPYDKNNIVQLRCHYDLHTTIEYSQSEKIISVNSGQSTSWEIKKIKAKQNLLTIRPILKSADTNLTVITTKRIYFYELRAREQWSMRSKHITFFLSYKYPNEIKENFEAQALLELKQEALEEKQKMAREKHKENTKINPSEINLEYTVGGDKSIAPLAVYDDGIFTYFKFDTHSDLPAIYIVDQDRNESLVNRHMEGEYMVVEQLGSRFTLRSGKRTTTVMRGKKRIQHAQNDISDVDDKDTTPRWWQ